MRRESQPQRSAARPCRRRTRASPEVRADREAPSLLQPADAWRFLSDGSLRLKALPHAYLRSPIFILAHIGTILCKSNKKWGSHVCSSSQGTGGGDCTAGRSHTRCQATAIHVMAISGRHQQSGDAPAWIVI